MVKPRVFERKRRVFGIRKMRVGNACISIVLGCLWPERWNLPSPAFEKREDGSYFNRRPCSFIIASCFKIMWWLISFFPSLTSYHFNLCQKPSLSLPNYFIRSHFWLFLCRCCCWFFFQSLDFSPWRRCDIFSWMFFCEMNSIFTSWLFFSRTKSLSIHIFKYIGKQPALVSVHWWLCCCYSSSVLVDFSFPFRWWVIKE